MAAYPNVNVANKYARDIIDGKIVACRAIRLACQRHFDDLKKSLDNNYPYRFDRDLAERACRFVQKLPHSSGDLAGQKLKLEPWQSFIFCSIFGWVTKKDKKRRFREAYIRVARKTGNRFLLPGLAPTCFALMAKTAQKCIAVRQLWRRRKRSSPQPGRWPAACRHFAPDLIFRYGPTA